MGDSVRRRVWRALERAGAWRLVLDAILLAALAALFTAALTLSLPSVDRDAAPWLHRAWLAAALVFGVEFLLRLWAAPEGAAGSPSRARLRYLASAWGVIDAGATVPYWLLGFGVIPIDVAEALSLLALGKLARFAPGLKVVATAFRSERRALLSALLALFVMVTVMSAVVYLLEREAQPQIFTSIPHAMWWGIVTIASVGYGDMAPVTLWGRLAGVVTIVLGLSTIAVPVGIMATAFHRELRRYEFMATWRTLADVPLFRSLDAQKIAALVDLLKPRVLPAGSIVVRRGDPADAMFFIVDGEAEVDIPPAPVRLKRGQYFGEIALVKDTPRTATVTAVEECHLFALDRGDFRRVIADHPEIADALAREAESRLAARAGEAPTGA